MKLNLTIKWQANELVHQNDIELQMMTAWLGFAKIGIICIIQGERWCQPKDRLICHTGGFHLYLLVSLFFLPDQF